MQMSEIQLKWDNGIKSKNQNSKDTITSVALCSNSCYISKTPVMLKSVFLLLQSIVPDCATTWKHWKLNIKLILLLRWFYICFNIFLNMIIVL